MHLYTSDERHAYFICMEPVDLSGARRKQQNATREILVHSGIKTHSPEI